MPEIDYTPDNDEPQKIDSYERPIVMPRKPRSAMGVLREQNRLRAIVVGRAILHYGPARLH
jgi:hypothetical protein